MSDRNRLIEDLVARYRKLLEQQLPRTPQQIDQIEQTVEEIGRKTQQELERHLIDQQQPPPDNRASCPRCGATARFRKFEERSLITCHGEHSFRRRYFYCAACEKGFAPLDLALGLDSAATTPTLRGHLARLAVWEPFEEAAATLAMLTGVLVSDTTLERTAVSVGQALETAQQERAQLHHQGRLPEGSGRPQRLYVSMDGVMVPLRNPWRRDGSLGKLTCRWGECKVGVVYEVRPGADGHLHAHQAVYTATLSSVETFEPLIATLAHERGHHFAREVIVLGDGAAWIWRIAAAQFPWAIEIIDFCHASQHLWKIAEAQFGRQSPAALAWVEQRKTELLKDEVTAVLEAIAAWKPTSGEGQKLKQTEYDYFAGNAERMRYGSFRRKGYQIASGVVESACKHVVASRLDQAGMHWRQGTAEAVVRLRAAVRSTPTVDLRPYCHLAA